MKRQRQAKKVTEQLLPDFRHHAISHVTHQIGLTIREEPFQHGRAENHQGQDHEEQLILGNKNFIQNRLHQQGIQSGHARHARRTYASRDQPDPVLVQVRQNSEKSGYT